MTCGIRRSSHRSTKERAIDPVDQLVGLATAQQQLVHGPRPPRVTSASRRAIRSRSTGGPAIPASARAWLTVRLMSAD